MDEIINKVSTSTLVTLDLKDFLDLDSPVIHLDLKDHLFQEMILREKDFREFVKNEDWSKYNAANVLIYCSADAIIPTWAYMILATRLESIAKRVVLGDQNRLTEVQFNEYLDRLDIAEFKGAKVVIKGCGDFYIPESCYVGITTKLKPVVSSIMYGEPCSTVPVYKNRIKQGSD